MSEKEKFVKPPKERGPMCLECPASLICETNKIVDPKRCTRCKCVEAILVHPNDGPNSLFRVAFACPRAPYTDGGSLGFYCLECHIAKMEAEADGLVIKHIGGKHWK